MIYLYYSCYVLKHIIDMFSYVLIKNNIEHKITDNINYESDKDLWIGIWNNCSVKMPKNYITINVEPLRCKFWSTQLQNKLKKSLYIFDYSASHTEIYQSWNYKNFCIIPFGYCGLHEKLYNKYIGANKVNKTIDILFYGSVTDRRKKILIKLAEHAKNKNLKFIIRSNDLYDTKQKLELISQSKIILSISNDEPCLLQTNDLLRLSLLVSTKSFVICEEVGDRKIEDELKKNMIFYNSYEELIEKIDYYLSNTDEINNIAESTYNFCKEKMNLEDLLPIEIITDIYARVSK